jgi:hypothetical protein
MGVKPKGSIKDLLGSNQLRSRLDRLLALIERGDRIDIQVHTHAVAHVRRARSNVSTGIEIWFG